MKLYFVTGNKDKFAEVKSILGEVEQLDIDLPEIQEIDARKIIEFKLSEAAKSTIDGNICVEDTSLYIEGLKSLPGPLGKWFLKTIGNEGLAQIAQNSGNPNAQALAIVGYKAGDKIEFFEGRIDGQIVDPRGENGFGWDKIFQPVGHTKTFAEMTPEEKNSVSMRKIAFSKLKDYLDRKI